MKNPLPEDVEIIKTVVKPGDGAITIGYEVIDKLVKEGALTSDEANNARGTVSLTIHATGGTIHPGDIIEFDMGDLNNDGKKEIVITGVTHNSPYDP